MRCEDEEVVERREEEACDDKRSAEVATTIENGHLYERWTIRVELKMTLTVLEDDNDAERRP